MNLIELKTHLADIFSEIGPNSRSALSEKIRRAIDFSSENYESFDDETKLYWDRSLDGLIEIWSKQVEASPESPAKRKLSRTLRSLEGKHLNADRLLQMLEQPTQLKLTILPAARSAVLQLTQGVLDLMLEVTKHTFKGPAHFAIVGLSYWAVDELLVGLDLAQHAMTNQAYAHVRTVHEILDKMELFDRQPQWAELWASDDEREVWKELKPSAVRAKLLKPKHDPVYSFLSNMGTHSTFRGLQVRGAKVRNPVGENATHIKLWVGGSKFNHDIMWANMSCVFAAISALATTMMIFEAYLYPEESRDAREEYEKVATTFFEKHFTEWAKEAGVPSEEAEEILRQAPWNPDRSKQP